MMVTVAEQHEYTHCHRTIHLKMVKLVNFMLYTFYIIKTKISSIKDTVSERKDKLQTGRQYLKVTYPLEVCI